MQLQRSEGMHSAAIARVLLAMSGHTLSINIVNHLVNNAKAIETVVLDGSRSDFDMAVKRGGYMLQMHADELVTQAYPDVCAMSPEVLKLASRVLVDDIVLNALCKLVNLWKGRTLLRASGDFLRAIVGCIDATDNGTQKARSLATALLEPFVGAAVLSCLSYQRQDSGPAIAKPDYQFTFELRVPHMPVELLAEDFEQQYHPAFTSIPPAQASSGSSSSGSAPKRPREGDEPEGPLAVEQQAADGADTSGSLAINHDTATALPALVQEGWLEPPQKKRRTDGSAQPPTFLEVDYVPSKQSGSRHTRAAKRRQVKQSGVKEQLAISALRNVANLGPLHHLSEMQCVFVQGSFTYGATTDALIGVDILRYLIMCAMHRVAPPGTLSEQGVALAIEHLSGSEMTARIVKALGFPASEQDPFMRAIGRASCHQPLQDLRKRITEIYAPLISSALKAIAPLRSARSTRSLASQRQHLRDVIRFGVNGTVFHLGLTPLQAVMGTDKKIVAAMMNEDAFKDVGIIRHWQQLMGRA